MIPERPADFAEESSQNRTAGPGEPPTRTQPGFEGLNPRQRAVLAAAPISARGIIERAYSGKSKAAGIKAFCLHCTGYSRDDVQHCTSTGCPLWMYRPYQKENDSDDGEEA